jgi:hypothetical protein
MDGVGDLYRVVLTGDNHGRRWQALLPREGWVRYNHGDRIGLSGVLTLYEIDGTSSRPFMLTSACRPMTDGTLAIGSSVGYL